MRDENALLLAKYAKATQRMDSMQLELDNLHAKQQTAAESTQRFTTFKAQCELYINLHLNVFTDKKMKVGFLINQLTGPPAHWATAMLIARDPILNNANLFIDALGKFLGVESCKEMAIHEIKRLKRAHLSHWLHY
uniref:DUF4939 domain-containing protein n=1 Tax=Varanus komodoensis TaxID=61221 RepID=A0A8D2LYB6_VARKO